MNVYQLEIPDYLIKKEISDILQSVNLHEVKDSYAGTFSGGMKRRLSMAIAFTGNPKIVFLDEPTTGMDPKNRRFIWDLILKLKKGKVVILTTHAMEEADILSDRIAVMVDGELHCVGTPLYLKNNFGDGYRLTIVTNNQETDKVIKRIQEVLPSCHILEKNAGSIIIGIRLLDIAELLNFFK